MPVGLAFVQRSDHKTLFHGCSPAGNEHDLVSLVHHFRLIELIHDLVVHIIPRESKL